MSEIYKKAEKRAQIREKIALKVTEKSEINKELVDTDSEISRRALEKIKKSIDEDIVEYEKQLIRL